MRDVRGNEVLVGDLVNSNRYHIGLGLVLSISKEGALVWWNYYKAANRHFELTVLSHVEIRGGVGLTMIKGPHLLWTGSNGLHVFGITVRSNADETKTAFRQVWNINDNQCLSKDMSSELGISTEEWTVIQDEIRTLKERQDLR